MKNTKTVLIALAVVAFAFSCKDNQGDEGNKENQKKHPDFAIVHGTVKNPKDSVRIRFYNPKTSKNTFVVVDDSGKFKDTMRLEKPISYNVSYNGIFKVYLSNGMDLEINFDGKKPKPSLNFAGDGAVENEYIQYKEDVTRKMFGEDYRAFLSQDEKSFNSQKEKLSDKLNKRLSNNELDTDFVASEKKKNEAFLQQLKKQRKDQMALMDRVGKGKTSPQFKDYKKYKGGTASLKDYRGSYVYIDVWATWCVPCIYEIPYLKKIEKKYEDKNIKFISLSVDNAKAEPKWRKMIENKELGESTQLLADNAMKSDFIQAYGIKGIPRFILLDPEGKVVSYDAPRPSMKKLKEMFDGLNI